MHFSCKHRKNYGFFLQKYVFLFGFKVSAVGGTVGIFLGWSLLDLTSVASVWLDKAASVARTKADRRRRSN